MSRRWGSSWLGTLSPEQRKLVYGEIERQTGAIQNQRHTWASGGYSVVLTPSLPPHRKVVLRKRRHGGRIERDVVLQDDSVRGHA